MATAIGLYFPFIHFKDDNWLKAMALYWDKMARIVPRGYATARDTEVVKTLAGELGFVSNIDPSYTRGPVSASFAAAIHQLPPPIREQYAVGRRNDWPEDPVTAAHAPDGSDKRLAYVMLDKMDMSLVHTLTGTGLGQQGRGLDGDMMWIGMHPELADAYMTALAEQMAADNKFEPLTDETLDHVSMAGWTPERLLAGRLGKNDQVLPPPPRGETEIESALASVAIASVIPKDLAGVPVQKIVALRKQHPEELARFQEWIHGLTGELANELRDVKSPAALSAHLDAYVAKSIAPRVKEFRKVLGSAGIDAAVSAMNVEAKEPGLVKSLTKLGVAVAAPVVAAAELVLSLLPVARDARKVAAQAAKAAPEAWLMHVEEGLMPGTLLGRVRQRARKFALGV